MRRAKEALVPNLCVNQMHGASYCGATHNYCCDCLAHGEIPGKSETSVRRCRIVFFMNIKKYFVIIFMRVNPITSDKDVTEIRRRQTPLAGALSFCG